MTRMVNEFGLPQSTCRFGVARCDVTPPVGIYHRMWGAASHDRSEGIHRPLTATAMVFQPQHADDLQVVVAVDHCLLFDREMQLLLQRVSAASEVDRERLLVVFSHTHAAGLMEERRADLPGGDLIAPYLSELAASIAITIEDALTRLQNVTITYSVGRSKLGANRDLYDDQSHQYVCGFNPNGETDDTVLVARVTDDSDRVIATITNYACHPTTLAWDNRLISPDFVGAMREVVESATQAPCVFLQGASGDVGPRDGFVGDVAIADRNGRQLGHSVLAALESLPPPQTRLKYAGPVVSGATIGTWRHVSLTNEQRCLARSWKRTQCIVPLPYRSNLPTVEETQSELDNWRETEQAVRAAGDNLAAADARAMVERLTRLLTRIEVLPPSDSFPFPVTLWCIGDAIWVAVEGEPYNALQRDLRSRFPDKAIIVMSLANGSRVSYLPTADTYGTGIYQESIALVDRGSLELLIAEIVDRLEALIGGASNCETASAG